MKLMTIKNNKEKYQCNKCLDLEKVVYFFSDYNYHESEVSVYAYTNVKHSIKIAYIEIYNEGIHDADEYVFMLKEKSEMLFDKIMSVICSHSGITIHNLGSSIEIEVSKGDPILIEDL